MKPTILDLLYKLSKPIIFGLNIDAETMHKLATEQITRIKNYSPPKFDSLSISFFNHNFTSPLMLAAGFDKNGVLVDTIPSLGFACEVVGSVTAKGSKGNEKPRLWRLPKEKSALNKMGLNSKSAEEIGELLQKKDNYAISIAKTPDPKIKGDEAINDFIISYQLLKNLGIYTEIDISCPSIKDGKTFENPNNLELLLDALILEGKGKPLLIKVSPYLKEEILQEIVNVSEDKIDGYVATNTISLIHPKYGKGGLSGLPLQKEAIRTIKTLRKLTNKPIIGVGGIFTGEDAYNFLDAGADLLQGFTGFIYRGPLYATKVANELNNELKSRGVDHISEIKFR